MTTDALQAALTEVLRMRGVETPCETCHGLGVKAYPSTATWSGNAGAFRSTKDVCDSCWGTGDFHRRGVDLRAQEKEEDRLVGARALEFVAAKAGAGIGTMRPAVDALVKELDGLSKTKNKPRPPWFSLLCEQVAKALKEGMEVKP